MVRNKCKWTYESCHSNKKTTNTHQKSGYRTVLSSHRCAVLRYYSCTELMHHDHQLVLTGTNTHMNTPRQRSSANKNCHYKSKLSAATSLSFKPVPIILPYDIIIWHLWEETRVTHFGKGEERGQNNTVLNLLTGMAWMDRVWIPQCPM